MNVMPSLSRSRKRTLCLASVLLLVACSEKIFAPTLADDVASGEVMRPGTRADGSVVLPNRWVLTPAGDQIDVGDLPLAMVLSADDRHLVVANNGMADQFVSIIDLETREEVQRLPMRQSWLGLAFNPSGDKLFVSGGGSDTVEVYRFEAGHAEHDRTLVLDSLKDAPKPQKIVGVPAFPIASDFAAGLAVSSDGRTLVVCALLADRILKFDLTRDVPAVAIPVGDHPYTVVVHPNNTTAFVSNWGGRSVSIVDLGQAEEIARIEVGSHPNAMKLSPDASKLYVTNSNSNEVSIIDLARLHVKEVVDLSPYPGAPASGTTPNGLALSSDGKTLFVANADNNVVALIDVSKSPAVIRGLIPTGWYPTAVALTRDDETLMIANGKGLRSKPNPKGPQPMDIDPENPAESAGALEFIGMLFPGTVSVLPVPDSFELARFTQQVIRNNGFDGMSSKLQKGRVDIAPRAIPRLVGEPSLIKYVFYIIKENRTYDQVLGDLPQGEGDPELTLFGREVTPNHHALAEGFVLFDNFYADAEVSADGHEWSMGAIATDFVEKTWPSTYSLRGLPFSYLGLEEIAYPDLGYLWDVAAAAGLSYRSYGEFVLPGPDGAFTAVESLEQSYATQYPPLPLGIEQFGSVKDVERAAIFIEEFKTFVTEGSVPRLNILSLPNDHTVGTVPGLPTPKAMVADHDLALGRIVEAISASPIWPESAIFVVEDDAQNGPDHIDSHRTVALVASPYAKRGYVDHTMYDTVSMLRTIELILGLPPMSQYDAAAIPMFDAFQDQADLTAYNVRPNQIPLDELNTAESYGADLSMRMNWETVDDAPENLLNEIIWKSIKGADSEMPRPHTSRARVE